MADAAAAPSTPSCHPSGDPGPFLHPLPPDVISSSVLFLFCDAASLSSVLTAVASSLRHRHHGLDTVASAVRLRVGALEDAGRLPARGTRWDDRVDLAAQLRGCCSCGGEAPPGAAAAAADAEAGTDPSGGARGEWERCLARIRRLSLAFPALSFFEDELGLQLRADDSRDDGSRRDPTSRAELPIWVGSLPFSFPGFAGGGASASLSATVVVTTPQATWHPLLLAEWAKLNDDYQYDGGDRTARRKGRTLVPQPRRATPLPPLARVSGISLRDKEALFAIEMYLRQTDNVIDFRTDGMAVLIMSRKQALRRLESDPIGRSFLSERSEEAWSLTYVSSGWKESECQRLRRAIRRYENVGNLVGHAGFTDIEDLGSYVQKDDFELFAFMDCPDVSNDEGEWSDLSLTVRDMISLIRRYPS